MSYSLLTSERSPFGRICRMFMICHRIDFDLRILNFVDDAQAAEQLAKESPINKVPILVVDGAQKIFDSRVIVNYLSEKHRLPELSIEDENRVSAIYSCLDVSVILFLMRQSGYNLNDDNSYLRRQKERIPRNLEFLEAWALRLDPRDSNDWNYATMSFYSFLYWANARAGTIHLRDYPQFQTFLEKFAEARGVRETGF